MQMAHVASWMKQKNINDKIECDRIHCHAVHHVCSYKSSIHENNVLFDTILIWENTKPSNGYVNVLVSPRQNDVEQTSVQRPIQNRISNSSWSTVKIWNDGLPADCLGLHSCRFRHQQHIWKINKNTVSCFHATCRVLLQVPRSLVHCTRPQITTRKGPVRFTQTQPS